MMAVDACCSSLYLWLLVPCLAYLLLLFWQKWRVASTFGKMGLQAARPLPLIGNMPSIIKEGLSDFFVKGMQQYGHVYGIFMSLGPAVVVSDPDMLRDLFVKKFASFPNRQPMLEFQVEPWKYNLLALRDHHWRRVRSILSPAFSSGKLKKMMPAVERVVSKLGEHTKDKTETGEPVELKKFCGAFAMDAIAGAAYGIQVDSLENPDDPFVKHAVSIVDPRNIAFPLIMVFPWLAPVFRMIGVKVIPESATNFFTSAIDSALADRQEGDKGYSDFLQVLLDMEKERESERNEGKSTDQPGLTRDEMFANAMVFLMAGYDTVSTAMAFTLFCLAGNPPCLEKVQAEIDAKIGQMSVNCENAGTLTYLDMCISEALRLYPPANILLRQAAEDVELGAYHIPRGWLVLVPVYAIHHNPQLWDQPEMFDPQRFGAEAQSDRHPFRYVPFGSGPRVCIGMRLAQLELRMALAAILKDYAPVLCDKSQYPPRRMKMSPHMSAQDGLWVRFGAEAQSDRHPFRYVPFGSGPRVCIGMRLAQLELRMALAAILKDYAPVLCDKSQYPPRRMKMSPHMSAQDGLWVRFQPRSATL